MLQAVGYIRTTSSQYDWIPIQIDKGKGNHEGKYGRHRSRHHDRGTRKQDRAGWQRRNGTASL